jgi:hypothetical protein
MSHVIDKPVKANDRLWMVCRRLPVVAAVLAFSSFVVAASMAGPAQPVGNPHDDTLLCDSCHVSAIPGKNDLAYDGNVSKLCRSCHDGRLATREGHPSEVKPTEVFKQAMSQEFTLKDGMLTCLTCHDVASRCIAGRKGDAQNSSFLRCSDKTISTSFCFGCHKEDSYQPFNAHDQIDEEGVKQDVCGWCHVGVPEIGTDVQEDASYGLHRKSREVCDNCHFTVPSHPIENKHTATTPSPEMRSYMAAYEIKYRMNLPIAELLQYVKAANRVPRQIPLDKDNRVTCYSCHNPHEKGLLPATNPRSVGAEGDKAANHRLRVREGIVCRACHYN